MCKTCEWCGKPIQDNTRNHNKKYCSNRCKKAAYRARIKNKSINIPEENPAHYPKYQLEDTMIHWQDREFHQNDNNWGLGESNLTQHPAGDKNLEHYYVKKELKRIFKGKPNP